MVVRDFLKIFRTSSVNRRSENFKKRIKRNAASGQFIEILSFPITANINLWIHLTDKQSIDAPIPFLLGGEVIFVDRMNKVHRITRILRVEVFDSLIK